MKTCNALKDVEDVVSNILQQAGFVDGLSLTSTQIENETDPIFWYIVVKDTKASGKETYITYHINDLEPYTSADGDITVRKAMVMIDIFSRNRSVNDFVQSVNDAFLNNEWTFELNSIDYDAGLKMFHYAFRCEALVMDDDTA